MVGEKGAYAMEPKLRWLGHAAFQLTTRTGKIILIDKGAMHGVDAAMMAHPMDSEWSTIPTLATQHGAIS